MLPISINTEQAQQAMKSLTYFYYLTHFLDQKKRTIGRRLEKIYLQKIKIATSRKNVSSVIFDQLDSNQPAQLQKLARILKLWI